MSQGGYNLTAGSALNYDVRTTITAVYSTMMRMSLLQRLRQAESIDEKCVRVNRRQCKANDTVAF